MLRFVCGVLVALAALNASLGHVASHAAEAKAEATAKAAESDPFRVPDGTIEDLQKYIEGLKNLSPPSNLRPASVAFRRQRAAAQLAASEKILTAKSTPTAEQIRMALRSKIAALTTLERLGDAAATAKIEATVQQAWRLVPPPVSPQTTPPPLATPQTSAAASDTPPLVLDVQFAILDGRAQQAAAMDGKQFSQLAARLGEFLKQRPVDGDGARLAVDVAAAGEESQSRQQAMATYSELSKLLLSSSDVKVASAGATLRGAARRLDLAGKPFVLEGATLAGRAIDPRKYQGKVVLVDFFAASCGPCREEVPNINKCYQAYHNRGFEIVAVSIDRDRKAIADFLDKEKYPWTVVLDRYEARGTDKSLATYYGIFTIPQMILVGRDGRVLSIDVRGQRLNKALDEQFGPVAEAAKNSAAGRSKKSL